MNSSHKYNTSITVRGEPVFRISENNGLFRVPQMNQVFDFSDEDIFDLMNTVRDSVNNAEDIVRVHKALKAKIFSASMAKRWKALYYMLTINGKYPLNLSANRHAYFCATSLATGEHAYLDLLASTHGHTAALVSVFQGALSLHSHSDSILGLALLHLGEKAVWCGHLESTLQKLIRNRAYEGCLLLLPLIFRLFNIDKDTGFEMMLRMCGSSEALMAFTNGLEKYPNYHRLHWIHTRAHLAVSE